MCACSVMSDSLWHHGPSPVRFLCPWNFPDKNTGGGAISYSRESFQSMDQTPVSFFLLHWQVGSLPLNHLGSPRESIEIANIGNNHHLQGWKQGEKVRPLGFRSLERVLCGAGTQEYAAQLVLVPHTGNKEACSGWEKGWNWHQLLLKQPAAAEATLIRTESIHQVSSPSACLPVSSQWQKLTGEKGSTCLCPSSSITEQSIDGEA